MPDYQNPELLDLFTVYTASARSIGAHLAEAEARSAAGNPLIVATASDLVLYPGNGLPPTIIGFRLSARGFRELAAISHFGPALATLSRLRSIDEDGPWRSDAERLLAATKAARAANSVELWRDCIAVPAHVGREAAIAAMVDYACDITERYLHEALKDPSYLTDETLRRDYLEGGGDRDLPVPFNRVMVATFFLTGLDIAHRLLTWFDGLELPWERTMVIIAGRQGRPTAGVTVETNSVAGIVAAVSRGRLPRENLLVAPHCPVFPMFDGTGLDVIRELEPVYRSLWSSIIATIYLGGRMFDGYPEYRPRSRTGVEPGSDTSTVSEMPLVRAPDDWFALVTRLRLVMEDPRQLLSGAVTDYAAAQLVACGNDPTAVVVPGLDGEPYQALR